MSFAGQDPHEQDEVMRQMERAIECDTNAGGAYVMLWNLLNTARGRGKGGGAKLTALCHMLVEDTELVWASIQGYLWGVRTWMKLQHQADPAYGVEHWDMLEQSCMVVAHVPAEPRKELPQTHLTRPLRTPPPSHKH